jgi:hypothetical protein
LDLERIAQTLQTRAASRRSKFEEMNMRLRLMAAMLPMLLAGSGACLAGDLNIHLMLSGEVAPGVYGQVQLGNEPRPPLVYAQPMLIEPQVVQPAPVYLHVPPGHARNWRKHCREYNACGRPVYFVRSAEYEPGYRYHEHDDHRDRDHDHHGRDHDDHDDHGHGHDHD